MKGLPDHDEDRPLLPPTARQAPSNINVWRAPRKPDQRYTGAQLAAMAKAGINPDEVEDVVVQSNASTSEMWWPKDFRPTPIFQLPCPIVERRGDGSQCRVISPYGTLEWVYSDGSITKARVMGFKGKRNRAGPRRG